jgi:hypothetical protein
MASSIEIERSKKRSVVTKSDHESHVMRSPHHIIPEKSPVKEDVYQVDVELSDEDDGVQEFD